MDGFYEMMESVAQLQDMISYGVDGLMALVFALAALVGLAQCFFGYKLMKLCFAIVGFVAGGVLGFGLTAFGSGEAAVSIAAAVVGAVLGALLLFHVYRLGVFVMNMALATVLMFLVTGAESNSGLIACLVVGLIVGIVSLIFVRVWTILSTGTAGGIMAGSCLGAILGSGAVGLVLGLVLAVLGILVQFRTTGRKKTAVHETQVVRTVYVETPAAPAVISAAREANSVKAESAPAEAVVREKAPAAGKPAAKPGTHVKKADYSKKMKAFAAEFAAAARVFLLDMKAALKVMGAYAAAGLCWLVYAANVAVNYGKMKLNQQKASR